MGWVEYAIRMTEGVFAIVVAFAIVAIIVIVVGFVIVGLVGRVEWAECIVRARSELVGMAWWW